MKDTTINTAMYEKTMKRKFSTFFSFAVVFLVSMFVGLLHHPAWSQEQVNVVTFLDAVARVCGGSTSEQVSSTGDNISLKTAEITVDPGTGSLQVKKDGILIAEIDGERSEAYYECVQGLTESLGGSFQSNSQSEQSSYNFEGILCSTRHEFEDCYAGNEKFREFLMNNVGNRVSLDVSTYAVAEGGNEGCFIDFSGQFSSENEEHWEFFIPTGFKDDCHLGYRLVGRGRALDPDSARTLAFWYGIRGEFHIGLIGSLANTEYQLSAR